MLRYPTLSNLISSVLFLCCLRISSLLFSSFYLHRIISSCLLLVWLTYLSFLYLTLHFHFMNVRNVSYQGRAALRSCFNVYYYMNTTGLTAAKLNNAVVSSSSAGNSADELVFGLYKSYVISQSQINVYGMLSHLFMILIKVITYCGTLRTC